MTLYVTSGYPGSGKTTWISQHLPDALHIIRDQVFTSLAAQSIRQRKKLCHQQVQRLVQQDTEQDICYDSINPDNSSRQFIFSLVPNRRKVLLYFEPSSLIKEGKINDYVTWLHQIRQEHFLFPPDHQRAVETINNISSIFEPPNLPEDVEIITIPSFLDSLSG